MFSLELFKSLTFPLIIQGKSNHLITNFKHFKMFIELMKLKHLLLLNY